LMNLLCSLVQWVASHAVSRWGSKRAVHEADDLICCLGSECVELNLCSPIYLYGLVLNEAQGRLLFIREVCYGVYSRRHYIFLALYIIM
jgi:hypothetical protein